jgi:hypothetical protein
MRGTWRFRKFRDEWRTWARLKHAEWRVARFPLIRCPQHHGLPGELVVSLTSYPPRFSTLSQTLRSLLDQTCAADRTILWIAEKDYRHLPSDVLGLTRFNLEIRSCDDLGSYKKLVPTLKAFPEACVVTADDDLYFRPQWLADLVAEAHLWPGCIIAHRAHLAVRDPSGPFSAYAGWELQTAELADRSEAALLFPTTGAGVIYPPRSLDARVTDVREFMRLCPTADDLWAFWMGRLAGTCHRRTSKQYPLVAWPKSQQVALFHTNLLRNENDRQIGALQTSFGAFGVTPCQD